MSQANPWASVAVYAEELAPAVAAALDAVSTVAKAVVRADTRTLGSELVTVLPSDETES